MQRGCFLPSSHALDIPLHVGGSFGSTTQDQKAGSHHFLEAPIFDHYSDSDDDPKLFSGSHLALTIISTPQGRFMYWKGFEPVELLDDSLLVANIPDLPF